MDYEIEDNYVVPEFLGKGVKFLIRVSGSSMQPKYSNGDILACRPITDLTFFQWGKVYVLDTDQGSVVKRLFPCAEDADVIECHSDNNANIHPSR
jgi:phage repressor protein C with HTH and peptisase S24 domain